MDAKTFFTTSGGRAALASADGYGGLVMKNSYTYSKGVKSMFVFVAVVCALLVVTLPIAVYILIKRSSAKLEFDDTGFRVSGLGLSSRWDFQEIARLGTLCVEIVGGGPLVRLNGGSVAVNLVAKTKSGKTLKFMLSRFEDWKEILERVERQTGLPLETVVPGIVGPAWPKVPGG